MVEAYSSIGQTIILLHVTCAGQLETLHHENALFFSYLQNKLIVFQVFHQL